MAADSLVHRFEKLEKLVKRLAEEHRQLKDELQKEKQEKAALSDLLLKQEEEIKNFQNQYKITKIVSSITDDTHGQTELKLLINEYIREIDKCIAHLSE